MKANGLAPMLAALTVALMLVATAGLNGVSAQSAVDYDADDDGLIEIEWLEQLDAVRWDLDGDGVVDDEGNAERYFAAFLDAAEVSMGCAEGCRGYELTRDLDFKSAGSYASGAVNRQWTSGNGWLPIGVGGSFDASFEGNRRTIANLYIDRSGANQPEVIGLFYVSRGNLERIVLVNTDITGTNFVGALVGGNYGDVIACSITGRVSGILDVGGLVGNNSGNLISSHTTSNVAGEGNIGGLVGTNGGSITSSHAMGNVSGSTSGSHGGLVGNNLGNIISSYSTGGVLDGQISGGLVGHNQPYGNITFSYSTGKVSEGLNIGGLVGLNEGSIFSSYAVGKVSRETEYFGGYTGGFVGENYGTIVSSYATGSVLVSGEFGYTGGFIGYNKGNVSFSYAISEVSGNNVTGGLVGANIGESKIVSSYWNAETSVQDAGVGEGSGTGIEGKTTAELQEPTDYTGIYSAWLLDLDNADGDYDEMTGVDDVWDFGTASQYPELKADLRTIAVTQVGGSSGRSTGDRSLRRHRLHCLRIHRRQPRRLVRPRHLQSHPRQHRLRRLPAQLRQLRLRQ